MDFLSNLNLIITYSVIVPITYILLNWVLIKELKGVFLILLASLFAELTSSISKNIFHDQISNVAYIYSIFEIGFLVHFYLSNSQGKNKFILYLLAFVLNSYILINFFFKLNNTSTVYALISLFELVITSIYMLKNTKDILRNWKFTIFFSFFQYNILAIGILSVVDFIAANQEYVSYYYIIHSLANLLMYVFITIAIIKCKKQYYKASLL